MTTDDKAARHGRVDCATGSRLGTHGDCEAHAAICAVYAVERAYSLAHPPVYSGGRNRADREDARHFTALKDRIRDHADD